MSIILDLIGISWLLLLIREQCKKGHTTFACILGILYSCVMMILAVPGPKWIFTIVSIIFVICTIRLILNESHSKWKDFWTEQSNKDGIERNLSFLMFIWVKVAYHLIEKHKPSRLSNFKIPEHSSVTLESSSEKEVIEVEADVSTNISAEIEKNLELTASEADKELEKETPVTDIISSPEEEFDLSEEADVLEESTISDDFVDL